MAHKKKEPTTRAEAVKLALAILEPFREAGNIYDDYQEDEGFTDGQYDEMLALLKKDGPYSILYDADGTIFQSGLFDTQDEALKWAGENTYPAKDYEFDISDQRVYLLRPDHRLEELTAEDIGVKTCPLCGEPINPGDETQGGNYGTVHKNCPDFGATDEKDDDL